MGAATAERTAGLDEAELAKQAAEIAGEDGEDGLGPDDGGLDDPNSEANTGIPGGRQPGDDGYVGEDPPADPPPLAADAGGPPTPPAALPDDGAAEAQEEHDEPQLFLTGYRELGLKVSGRKPDSSVLKLKGGKIDVQGQFNREDRFITVTTLQVTGDNDQDTIDRLSGEVKSTSKAQSATLCGIALIEDWLGEKLGDEPDLLRAVLAKLELDA